MQISRMFQTVYLLLERGTVTAKELAERFEVSPRTVYRDVEALAQAGIPIYAERGKGGGIRLMEDFVLNKSVLSEAERTEILTALQGMNAVRQEETGAALQKLSALFGGGRENWIQVDFGAWNPSSVLKERFERLKEAILSRRVVRFTYSGANGKTALRETEPLCLTFRGYDWYVLAWCRERNDSRYFKLTRMSVPELTEERFPPRVLPEPAAEQGASEFPQAEVTVTVDARLAYRVLDEFPPEQRERREDGSFLIRLSMAGGEWLYHFLMTYGEALEVLEPQEVRRELADRYRRALARYEEKEKPEVLI